MLYFSNTEFRLIGIVEEIFICQCLEYWVFISAYYYNISIKIFTLQYDHNYVGTPLPKEVSFFNLNDNIDNKFLEDMCKGFGTIEECKIYYHPKTRKHLGIGKVSSMKNNGHFKKCLYM